MSYLYNKIYFSLYIVVLSRREPALIIGRSRASTQEFLGFEFQIFMCRLLLLEP